MLRGVGAGLAGLAALGLAGVTPFGGPGALAAQTSEALTATWHTVDSLGAELREARATLERAEAEAAARLESFEGIEVMGLDAQVHGLDPEVARHRLERAWRVLGRSLGPPPARALEGVTLVLHDGGLGRSDDLGDARTDTGREPMLVAVHRDARRTAGELRRELERRVPARVQRWVEPLGMLSDVDEGDIVRAAVLSGTATGPACMAGRTEACRSALFFEDLPRFATEGAPVTTEGLQPWVDRVREWYEPGTLQAVIRRHVGTPATPPRGGLANCLDDASVTWCENHLASLLARGEADPWLPLGIPARTSLLRHALRVGGEGAMDRLLMLDDETPPRAALERVSGHDTDALVSSWLEALPQPGGPGGGSQGDRERQATITWIAVLAAGSLALTKWRTR